MKRPDPLAVIGVGLLGWSYAREAAVPRKVVTALSRWAHARTAPPSPVYEFHVGPCTGLLSDPSEVADMIRTHQALNRGRW